MSVSSTSSVGVRQTNHVYHDGSISDETILRLQAEVGGQGGEGLVTIGKAMIPR